MSDYYRKLIGKPILWADSTGTLNKGTLEALDPSEKFGEVELPPGEVFKGGSNVAWVRVSDIQDPAARKARQRYERFGV